MHFNKSFISIPRHVAPTYLDMASCNNLWYFKPFWKSRYPTYIVMVPHYLFWWFHSQNTVLPLWNHSIILSSITMSPVMSSWLFLTIVLSLTNPFLSLPLSYIAVLASFQSRGTIRREGILKIHLWYVKMEKESNGCVVIKLLGYPSEYEVWFQVPLCHSGI